MLTRAVCDIVCRLVTELSVRIGNMFDFIKKEKHPVLKKILGVSTLLGVGFETVGRASTGDWVGFGVSAIVGLFVVLWLLEAMKEGARNREERLAEKWRERYESELSLNARPTPEMMQSLKHALSQLMVARFPRKSGGKVTDEVGFGSLRVRAFRKGSSCSLDISVELKEFVSTKQASVSLLSYPELYLGTLKVTVAPKSSVKGIFFGVLLGLIALHGIFEGANQDESAKLLFAITVLWMMVTLVVYFSTRYTGSRWFPEKTVQAVRSDVMNELADHGVGEAQHRSGEHREYVPFWPEQPVGAGMRRKLVWTALVIGLSVSVIFWRFPGLWKVPTGVETPSVVEGEKALGNGDYDLAEQNLRPFAAKGDLKAKYLLSEVEFKKNNFEAWGKLRQEAADAGYAAAQFEIGYDLLVRDRETEQGIAWVKRAADQGFRAAETQLAMVYDNWSDVPHQPQEAIRLYELAASQGDNFAQYNLARIYESEARKRKRAYFWARVCEELHDEKSLLLTGKAECHDIGAEVRRKLSQSEIEREESEVARFVKEHGSANL